MYTAGANASPGSDAALTSAAYQCVNFLGTGSVPAALTTTLPTNISGDAHEQESSTVPGVTGY
jgi:hypothetical protein